MADLKKLEGKVGEKTPKGSTMRYTVALLTLGVGLIAFGVYLAGSGSSITASTNPPTPDDPSPRTASSVTPPTPNVPSRDGEYPPVPTLPGKFSFTSGWSMISGDALYGYDLTDFRNAGLALYSFNDPKYANRDFAVVFGDAKQCAEETIGCDVIDPQPPLGYYVYNPKSSTVSVDLAPGEAPDLAKNIFGRGWHVFYWGGDAVSESELLERLTITYSDGKKLTAKQAMTDAEHRVSLKIFGVVDETTIDKTKAIRELGSENTATQIITIPKEGYFWMYLRRTPKRVTAITVDDNYTALTASEKSLIDTWIVANNLNECGDPKDTMYTGGSCLFDESTGQNRDKYELIIGKFPQKPWRN